VSEITPDEIMVTCIAHQIHDGETVVQGLATPLVAAGYLLARATHAPGLYFASAIGQGICRHPAPLGLTLVESQWLDRSLVNAGFVFVATEYLPTAKPKEFFRPAQVDRYGNFNNIAFGKNYLGEGRHQPRMRLPGSGGIPDVTPIIEEIYLYVPRHSRVTFVEQLDVRSGLGHSPERKHGAGPNYLISDMGQFDFAEGRMRLLTYHPGTTVAQIQAKTGFPLDIAPNVYETPPPTLEEMRLLREEIDPLNIRKLELLSGNARRDLLHQIVDAETVMPFDGGRNK
jgi:acyl CoA:acetate/3-ketoacid CoA transferase beta subunit